MRVHLVQLDEDRLRWETAAAVIGLPCSILLYLFMTHSTREGLAVSWRALLEDLPFLLLGAAVAWALAVASAAQVDTIEIPPVKPTPARGPASSEAEGEPAQPEPRVVPIATKREAH